MSINQNKKRILIEIFKHLVILIINVIGIPLVLLILLLDPISFIPILLLTALFYSSSLIFKIIFISIAYIILHKIAYNMIFCED